MKSEADPTVLRKKASANPSAVGPTAMDFNKAVRFAAAKSGDRALGVAVGVRELVETQVLPDDLEAGIPDGALLLRVTDPAQAVGVIAVCPKGVAAVLEASTLGTVLATEADPRPPTRTDAVLVSTFLDMFLNNLSLIAEEFPKLPPVNGYQTAETFPDLRSAQLAMADTVHLRFEAKFDFGLGAKVTTIVIFVPKSRVQEDQPDLSMQDWSRALEKAVLNSATLLHAVLGKVKIPLEQISKFAVGDVVPLKGVTVDNLRLLGQNGDPVSLAKLGRSGSMRAVRVVLYSEEDALAAADAVASELMPDIEPQGFAPPMALESPEPEMGGALGAIEPMGIPAIEMKMG